MSDFPGDPAFALQHMRPGTVLVSAQMMCCSTKMKNEFRDWSDIRVFLAVFREGSTLAASRKLGVAQPIVARRIDALEQAAGLVLFERDTRGFQPTDNARALFTLAERMEADAVELVKKAQDLSRPRPIRITAPENFGDTTMGIFSAFAAAHPGIAIKFEHSMQVLDLLKGEADIAFRVSNEDHDPELIQRKLGMDRFALYGSQDYANRYRLPLSQHDMTGHRFITFQNPHGPSHTHDWLVRHVSSDQIASSFNEMSMVDAAAKAGHGLAVLHTRYADNEAGLIRCSDPIEELSVAVTLLMSPESYRRPEVKTFIKFFAPRVTATFES
ncbi:LysR family transcriptional regulator [uncultured Ruegeria sp.]|uniref:LysR family transcriptional regulator n=1 Tax=uncultured Ruegeria sp. TaxID=259304 RepID=UPI00262F2239|nr:LysR family transcriptional regulator [uncultured Ruegeria sp.]